MHTYAIGDVVLYDTCVGVVTHVKDDTLTIDNNFGKQLTVQKDKCTLIESIKDVLQTYEEEICKSAKLSYTMM